MPLFLYICIFQEQEENKGATSWPEYYIDQLNSMAAVSSNMWNYFTFMVVFCINIVYFFDKRKTLLALEKEDEEERNKTIESLKTALRTQPMRWPKSFNICQHLSAVYF